MNIHAPPTSKFGEPFAALNIEEGALSREFTPRALLFWEDAQPKPYRMSGDVAVVEITGALDTRAGWWWDGYDAVCERVTAALNDPKVRAVVLSIDSPGGAAAGNLDAAQALRAAVDTSGKPCVAHAGTMAASAAYALACAADHIVVTTDGTVGSIGTIATVYDRTKANEQDGYDVRVVRSGTLKADPHPDVPLTDASVARVRARVVELAGFFAGWVQQRRPAMADPLSLQGAVVYGADAVSKGLADAVGTLADAISTAAALAADSTTKRKVTMDQNKASALLAVLRASAGAETDDELVASVATLKTAAAQVPDLTRQLTEARAELATRKKADGVAARQAVMQKHRDRLALTEAHEADTQYMADLEPLSPEALDRVLSKLPALATQATKAIPAGAAATSTGGRERALTADEQKMCRMAGITEDEYRATLAQQEKPR